MNSEKIPKVSNEPTPVNQTIMVGPTRQLLAIFYDAWLLAAVFMVASAITLPFTHGKPVEPGNPFMTTYIFFIWYGFYAWFWTHGGQTLGMRSWKIKLITNTGEPLSLWHALLRFITGIPAWTLITIGCYLLISQHPDLEHPVIDALSKLPPGLTLAIGCVLLIADHWKNSWRNRFSSTQVILAKKPK